MARPFRVEIALAVLVVIGGALYARLAYIPPFPERHVESAEQKYDIEVGSPNRWFSAWSVGDGQAFAVIAADPSGGKLGEEVKEPAYRFSRAGYGWLSYLAALGRERWIPYGMAIVGTASVVGSFWLALSLRPRLGQRAWLLVLNPAMYLGFAGDTAEPLAVFALTAALAGGSYWAALLLGVTRPSYLLASIGRPARFAAGVGIAVALLGYSLLRFGIDQLVPDGGRIGLPLAAYLEHSSVAGWALALLSVITVVVGLLRREWAWVAAGALVVCLGSDVTANPQNAWRAAGMLPVLWALGPNYVGVATSSKASDELSSQPMGM